MSILRANLFILILISLIYSFNGKLQFRETSYNFLDVCGINNTAWAVGQAHWDGQSKRSETTILVSYDAGQTWIEQYHPSNINLNSVFFIDGETGWVAGDKGTVLKTINGGVEWLSSTIDLSFQLTSIKFTDPQNGWASGIKQDVAALWKTDNGGDSWIRKALPNGVTKIQSIYFLNGTQGWIAGSGLINGQTAGVVYSTIDGGLTWSNRLAVESNLVFQTVNFVDANYGWVAGTNTDSGTVSTIYSTTNGGVSWGALGLTDNFRSVNFVNKNRGVAAGSSVNSQSDPVLLRTLDGGSNWQELRFSNTGERINGVWASNNHLVAVASRSTVIKSSDVWGGGTLRAEQLQPRYSFTGAYFSNESTGWIVGTKSRFDHGNQVIMHTTNGGNTWNCIYERDTLCDQYGRLYSRIMDFAMLEGGTCIAVGNTRSHTCDESSSTVLKSNDGGLSWEIDRRYAQSEFYALFSKDNSIWLLPEMIDNNPFRLFHSVDNGNTFGLKTYSFNAKRLNQGDVFFVNSNNGWVVGGNGFVVSTVNGGDDWNVISSGSNQAGDAITGRCQTVCFSSLNHGWIGGEFLYETRDGGQNWVKRDIGFVWGDIFDIQFLNESTGWLAGAFGAIMKTTDGGNTWITESNNNSRENYQTLRAIYFVNDSTGWACGDGGSIVKVGGVVSGVVSFTRMLKPGIKASISRNKLVVSCNVKKRSNLQLELLDMQGRQLQVFNLKVIPGDQVFSFNVADIRTGLYVLRGEFSGLKFSSKVIVN